MARSRWLRWLILQLQLCIACGVSDMVVKVRKGQSVKLPCTYSVRQVSDISVMCWGQGMCPISKCSNEIVRTDGWKVTSAQSHRYQLHGAIANGDVSLTISNVGFRDKGMYCCRIEIPGLFNDIKRNLNLKIDPALTTRATTTTIARSTTMTPPLTTTAPPLTTTAPPLTSMAALPRPTTPPTTPTSDLPATTSSPTTTIFQSTPASTEDGFIFSTTELVLQTADSPMTDLISEGTAEVGTAFIPEDALRTDTTTSATTTTTAPPLTSTAALPEPTTAPVTPTSDLPATTPSPTTTIFQSNPASTEDGFIFSTTELVLQTADSLMTDLISEGTAEVGTAFIPEDALRTGTVPVGTFQAPPEARDANVNSYAAFSSTPSGDLANEGRGQETTTDSKLQSQESADNQKQHLENEIPTVIICMAVASLLLTLLLAVLVANRCSRKSPQCCQKGMKRSSDSPREPEKILNEVEKETSLLILQPIPDDSPGSQETSHNPEESGI